MSFREYAPAAIISNGRSKFPDDSHLAWLHCGTMLLMVKEGVKAGYSSLSCFISRDIDG